MASETRYERCQRLARKGHGCVTDAEVKRVAGYLFAKELVGGATLGRVSGRTVVDRKPQAAPRLP